MVTDDTGLSSDGTQTVSDDCTSFPVLHPSLSLWRGTRHKGRPRCPLAALKRHLLMETATLPLLFHLAVAPSISIYADLSRSFSLFFSLALCPPVHGGYTEVRERDNDSPPFNLSNQGLFFLSALLVLSLLILSLLIFSYSLVLMRLRSLI